MSEQRPWIRRRVYMPCSGCRDSYRDFGPGRLTTDRTTEIRTCPECGTMIETEPYFECPPNEETAWDLR